MSLHPPALLEPCPHPNWTERASQLHSPAKKSRRDGIS